MSTDGRGTVAVQSTLPATYARPSTLNLEVPSTFASAGIPLTGCAVLLCNTHSLPARFFSRLKRIAHRFANLRIGIL